LVSNGLEVAWFQGLEPAPAPGSGDERLCRPWAPRLVSCEEGLGAPAVVEGSREPRGQEFGFLRREFWVCSPICTLGAYPERGQALLGRPGTNRGGLRNGPASKQPATFPCWRGR